MDNSAGPDRNSEWKRKNPSLGLGFWGPLVPANDCKSCLATLAGLQVVGGVLLWLRPTKRPPARSLFVGRLFKAGEIIAGTYLIFTAGLEFARLALPYDPWVEDAKAARLADDLKHPDRSNWDPRTWRYKWFGPSSYRPVSMDVWKSRTNAYLERAEKARPHFENLKRIHDGLVAKNRSAAENVLTRIKTNQLAAPEIPVHDLELLGFLPEFKDEGDFYDKIDLSDANLWEFFEEPHAFSVVVTPRSTPAFLPGVVMGIEDEFNSQKVNYLPIPQAIKNGLR